MIDLCEEKGLQYVYYVKKADVCGTFWSKAPIFAKITEQQRKTCRRTASAAQVRRLTLDDAAHFPDNSLHVTHIAEHPQHRHHRPHRRWTVMLERANRYRKNALLLQLRSQSRNGRSRHHRYHSIKILGDPEEQERAPHVMDIVFTQYHPSRQRYL